MKNIPEAVTFYLISVKLDDNEWILEKRYSQFDSINNELIKLFGSRIPLFPPKTFFKLNTIEGIENRRKDLDLYLKAIVSIPEVLNSIPVRDFLEVI